jgi:hypothetical protein
LKEPSSEPSVERVSSSEHAPWLPDSDASLNEERREETEEAEEGGGGARIRLAYPEPSWEIASGEIASSERSHEMRRECVLEEPALEPPPLPETPPPCSSAASSRPAREKGEGSAATRLASSLVQCTCT